MNSRAVKLHDLELAWALVAIIRDHLDTAERTATYVAVGGGDTCTAIRLLTSIAVRERVPLSREVAAALRAWWAARDNRAGDSWELMAALRTQPEPPPTMPLEPKHLVVKRQYRRIDQT